MGVPCFDQMGPEEAAGLADGQRWTRQRGDEVDDVVVDIAGDEYRVVEVHGDEDVEILVAGHEGKCLDWLRSRGYAPPASPVLVGRISDDDARREALRVVLPLCEAMQQRCVSQRQLHRETGVAQDAISKAMSGQRVPDMLTLIRLAHALGMEVALRPKK